VEVTHVSWLCNQGVFRPSFTGAARERAIRAVQRMGYELHVGTADLAVATSQLTVALTVTNTGVAPFYYDWPVELGALDLTGKLATTWTTDWKLTGIQPGAAARRWHHSAKATGLSAGTYQLLLRVPNPMAGGKPLRFANTNQDKNLAGWLTLGEFAL
jgi:hypothetical protein